MSGYSNYLLYFYRHSVRGDNHEEKKETIIYAIAQSTRCTSTYFRSSRSAPRARNVQRSRLLWSFIRMRWSRWKHTFARAHARTLETSQVQLPAGRLLSSSLLRPIMQVSLIRSCQVARYRGTTSGLRTSGPAFNTFLATHSPRHESVCTPFPIIHLPFPSLPLLLCDPSTRKFSFVSFRTSSSISRRRGSILCWESSIIYVFVTVDAILEYSWCRVVRIRMWEMKWWLL